MCPSGLVNRPRLGTPDILDIRGNSAQMACWRRLDPHIPIEHILIIGGQESVCHLQRSLNRLPIQSGRVCLGSSEIEIQLSPPRLGHRPLASRATASL